MASVLAHFLDVVNEQSSVQTIPTQSCVASDLFYRHIYLKEFCVSSTKKIWFPVYLLVSRLSQILTPDVPKFGGKLDHGPTFSPYVVIFVFSADLKDYMLPYGLRNSTTDIKQFYILDMLDYQYLGKKITVTKLLKQNCFLTF